MRFGWTINTPMEEWSLDVMGRLFGRLRSLGYEAVEPFVNRPELVRPLEKFQRALDGFGLKLSGIKTGLLYFREGLSLIDLRESVRLKSIERVKAIIKFAEKWDPAPPIIIGSIQGRVEAGDSMARAKRRLRDSLSRCLDSASERVRLLVEPLNRYELDFNNTMAEAAELVDKLDRKRVALLADTFHMNIEEKDIAASILKFRRHIGHIQLADSNRDAPGQGHIDFGPILDAVRAIGYRWYLAFELRPQKDELKSAELAIKHVRRLLRT